MMQGKAVLALWIDIDPAVRDECDDWYINRHIADRIAVPGWRRVRRFQGVQDAQPATLALYEVQEPEDLVSDGYLRLQRNVEATDIRMRAMFHNVVRDTFKVRHSSGRGEGGLMLSLRFRTDTANISDEAVALAVTDEIIPALAALHGIVAIHLLQQAPEFREIHDGHRKSGSDDARAHWVLLVEATRGDYAETAGKLLRCWPDGKVLGLSDAEVGLYDLMYAV
ncbi:hypothetical protein CR155_19825 [Pollutimonas nitritireducens]|uniref:Uncharacterized protein n=1 Tax=Pollutimonas nitritireducens TaxID=2045209 RepID=A0A2N4UAV8_9BURK|nr:hypothetical protein [Pollutimonas nitritireducens]PLC52154.1 hypothetical protein CR155_19825 [Pollutimonas nitritireducens]